MKPNPQNPYEPPIAAEMGQTRNAAASVLASVVLVLTMMVGAPVGATLGVATMPLFEDPRPPECGNARKCGLAVLPPMFGGAFLGLLTGGILGAILAKRIDSSRTL